MRRWTRREFLRSGAALAAAGVGPAVVSERAWLSGSAAAAQTPPEETPPAAEGGGARGVEVLHPRGRIPLSFIIDDSTCLVNMGHFCMPQFAEAWPDREIYRRPWKTWPREIPDAFLREFGEWCAEHGVKGKFSVVPYPACVGWLDRELPGWSRRELLESLKLVRELMVPRWDIHPEMVSHTRVIDIRTGRPLEEISSATMENSYPRTKKSVDELASYLAYALRILKNCDLPCEGITTPGGFGNGVNSELSLAVHDAVRDVFGAEIPHYFKYVSDGGESAEPKLEHVRGLGTADVKVTVNVLAGTGDWFGGWDGDERSQGFKYAADDASGGRMVELIQRGEPAIMLCHWPGMYTHGSKSGFEDFKKVVLALEGRFRDETRWMKVDEIARYWAAKGLTRIERTGDRISFDAPFAAEAFTVRIRGWSGPPPSLVRDGAAEPLDEVRRRRDLAPGTWFREGGAIREEEGGREAAGARGGEGIVCCFGLPKGKSVLDPVSA